MRITIKHPLDSRLVAVAGHDHALGWFAEIRNKSRVIYEYDGLVTGGATTLQGVLGALLLHGFFTRDTLEEALNELPHVMSAEIADPAVRRVAEAVEGLRSSASDG